MKIRSIRLSWFRGAAANDALETTDRSLVVYGANGSGKSSFVDAIEYALNDGRIRHLAHEYSGKHQEKAVLNTHRPDGQAGTIEIEFADATKARIEIEASGTHTVTGTGKQHLDRWDYRRTVLRQDEVSHFIHSTKGEKYSVLLPLLGLGHLEVAADNFRQLAAAVRKLSGIKEASVALRAAWTQFENVYGKEIPSTAASGLLVLCERFGVETKGHASPQLVDLLQKAIDARLDDANAAQRLQVAVEQLASIDIKGAIAKVRSAAADLAKSATATVQRQLDVIRAATAFLTAGGSSLTACPACGQSVARDAMADHLDRESMRLEGALEKSRLYRATVDALFTTAQRVTSLCASSEITNWARTVGDERVPGIVATASAYVLNREESGDSALNSMAGALSPAVVAAASAAAFLPTPAKDLARAKEQLLAIRGVLRAESAVDEARKGEAVAIQIDAKESGLRTQIHDQTIAVIDSISADIQRMWRILHPVQPIEGVRLHIPGDSDKALDISLQFYGKHLASPRLTLSEGYRNSLGLCVFLAMAARNSGDDDPIVLDDVIVSLDRAHRGMVATLLQKEFGGRQTILLTHDRDWYGELRQHLGNKTWSFRALVPYKDPKEGIRWSQRVGTFDDARAFLDVRADVAANEARKVMDVELSIHADGLGISLPFARGERNDRRGAHEFLSGLINGGKAALKRKDATTAKVTPAADVVAALEAADKLLLTWANRGSHTEDVERSEAELLIDTCEAAISSLKCSGCGKFVHFAETGPGEHQCECGGLRWK